MDAIREIKLLQELRHPNVMKVPDHAGAPLITFPQNTSTHHHQVMDIFNHDSNINIVMQFMEMDLEKIIKYDPQTHTHAHTNIQI